MLICDVCKEDVAQHSLETNKVVYGLLPVTVGTTGYGRAEWMDSDDGMTQFIHDKCLQSIMERFGHRRKEYND